MTNTPTIREQFEEKFGWAGSSGTFTGIRDEEIVKFITAEREAGAKEVIKELRDMFKDTHELGTNHLNSELDRLENK